MEFRVVKNLAANLTDVEANRRFMEMVELRQRLFREHRETILTLDAYDLIANHVLLYSSQGGKLIGYLRAIERDRCRAYQVEYPLASMLKDRPEYAAGFARFDFLARKPIHMGYLCFDPAYKAELQGVKALDLLVWIALTTALDSTGVSRDRIAFSGTANNRYKQDTSMRLLGEWIPDLPDLDHPMVADKHRVVLIPKISEHYWEIQQAKFSSLFQTLGDGERDLLVHSTGIAA